MALSSYDIISQTIIDQINSIDKWCIIAYNNDITPFTSVFYILKTVVPLTDEEAFNLTNKIHTEGQAVVYVGSKEHCEKIKDALTSVFVKSEIKK